MPRRVRSTRRTTTSSIGPAGPATTLGGRAGGDRQCIYPSLLIVVSEIYNVRCPPYYTVVCCAHAFALVLAWAGPPTYLTVEGPEEMEGQRRRRKKFPFSTTTSITTKKKKKKKTEQLSKGNQLTTKVTPRPNGTCCCVMSYSERPHQVSISQRFKSDSGMYTYIHIFLQKLFSLPLRTLGDE